MCIEMLPEGCNWSGWTDRQPEDVPNKRALELNALAPALVLTLGTDRVIPVFDLGERHGRFDASFDLLWQIGFAAGKH